MPKYRTGDAIGTASAKNLYDDAQDLDNLMLGPESKYPDRLWRNRLSYSGFEALAKQAISDAGFYVVGDYSESLLTLTNYNQVVKYNGEYFKLKPSIGYPYTTQGTSDSSWASEEDNFLNVSDALVRQALAKADGSLMVGHGASTVGYELSRFGSYKALDVTPDTHGYSADLINNYNKTVVERGNDDVLLYGGTLAIGHRTYGTAITSCALSVRSGVELGSQYNPQLGGTNISTQTMASGEGIGGVTAYIDAVSLAYQEGEILNSPTYTDMTVTSDDVATGVANGLIKVGAVLKTGHSTPWQGIISSIDGTTLTVRDGWWQKGATAASTPDSGTTCYVNYQRSIWAQNINTILYENGRASAGYCTEYGMQNLSGNMNGVIGISLLHMKQSTSDSQYGLQISRGDPDQSSRWDTGCFVGGSRINYYSHGYSDTSYGLYLDGKYDTAIIMLGIGDSKYALGIRNEAGAYSTMVAGSGQVQRLAQTSVNLGQSATGTITPDYQEYHSDYGAQQTITIQNTMNYSMYQHFRLYNSLGSAKFVPSSGYLKYGKYNDVTAITVTGPIKLEIRVGWASTVIPLLVEAGTVSSLVSASAGTVTF